MSIRIYVYMENLITLHMLSTCSISHIQVDENITYGEVPHCTTNTSRNDLGGFGMEENVAYGQAPRKSINMSMNEAYAAFPRTGDYEDI